MGVAKLQEIALTQPLRVRASLGRLQKASGADKSFPVLFKSQSSWSLGAKKAGKPWDEASFVPSSIKHFPSTDRLQYPRGEGWSGRLAEGHAETAPGMWRS